MATQIAIIDTRWPKGQTENHCGLWRVYFVMIVGRRVYKHKRRLIGSVSNASLLVCGFFPKIYLIDFLYMYI
jgi:hypothetical protein